MEQLDNFYVSDWAAGRGGQAGVVPGMTLSDHTPVILTLDSMAQSLALGHARFRIPSLPKRRSTIASLVYGAESGMLAGTWQSR